MVNNLVKGTLILAFVLVIIHWVYAHLLKGNNPPELMVAIVVLAIPMAVILTMKKIR